LGVFLLLWLALSPSRLEQIHARGRLIVSVKNEGVPQPELHKDPAHFQKRGFELELARAIAARVAGAPDRLELRLMPRRERLPALVAGKVDLVISMIPVGTVPDVEFSIPYFAGGLALMVARDSPIHRVSDLVGTHVGIVRAHANDPTAEVRRIFAERKIAVSVEFFDRVDDAAEALAARKIAAVAGQLANLDGWTRTHRQTRLADEMLSHQEFAVAVHKGEEDLRSLVDEVIRGLAKKGELERMARRWQLPYRAAR
jgi:putative glutamine transport system substrate-binding protein